VIALGDLVRDELNVKGIRVVADPGELVAVAVKANFRSLGPRFGKQMPALAAAIAELPGAEVARALEQGEAVRVAFDGTEAALGDEDLIMEARPTEGYAVGHDRGVAVGLATDIGPELAREGLAREIVHAVQGVRRAAGLRVEERIVLHLDGSGRAREAIEAHREQIGTDTLAIRLSVGHGAPMAGLRHEEVVLDGEPVAIRIDRAPPD
jgi:isoleucyl-tRNA synthetase